MSDAARPSEPNPFLPRVTQNTFQSCHTESRLEQDSILGDELTILDRENQRNTVTVSDVGEDEKVKSTLIKSHSQVSE